MRWVRLGQTPSWASSSPHFLVLRPEGREGRGFWEWDVGAGPSLQESPGLQGPTAVRGPQLGETPFLPFRLAPTTGERSLGGR